MSKNKIYNHLFNNKKKYSNKPFLPQAPDSNKISAPKINIYLAAQNNELLEEEESDTTFDFDKNIDKKIETNNNNIKQLLRNNIDSFKTNKINQEPVFDVDFLKKDTSRISYLLGEKLGEINQQNSQLGRVAFELTALDNETQLSTSHTAQQLSIAHQKLNQVYESLDPCLKELAKITDLISQIKNQQI